MSVLPNPFLNSASSFPALAESAAVTTTPTPSAAAEPISESQANASAEARPTENWGRQAGLSDGEAAIVAPVAEDASRLAAGRTAAATSETMDATSRRDENSIHDPDATDNIGEIFTVPRRLLAENNHRAEDFVDWAELEAALQEPLPLFIRDDGYLKRRA